MEGKEVLQTATQRLRSRPPAHGAYGTLRMPLEKMNLLSFVSMRTSEGEVSGVPARGHMDSSQTVRFSQSCNGTF